jgi:hypothetical protein
MSEPIRCPGQPRAPLELCYWCEKFDPWPFRHEREVWITPAAAQSGQDWSCADRVERRRAMRQSTHGAERREEN